MVHIKIDNAYNNNDGTYKNLHIINIHYLIRVKLQRHNNVKLNIHCITQPKKQKSLHKSQMDMDHGWSKLIDASCMLTSFVYFCLGVGIGLMVASCNLQAVLMDPTFDLSALAIRGLSATPGLLHLKWANLKTLGSSLLVYYTSIRHTTMVLYGKLSPWYVFSFSVLVS